MTLRLCALTLLITLISGLNLRAESVEIGSGRQPSLCVDSNGNLVLTYLEGGEVYVRTSSDRDNKLHFDEPISISSLKGKSMQTMRRGPKIVSSGDALVVSAIMKTDDGNADLYVTRSIDHGTTWSESIRVNSVSNSAREGLHSMTSDGGNRIGIVWLDLRSEKTEVWCAISKDNGKTFGKDALVYRSPDGATCECCKPEINFDAMGRVNVMFRNHLGEVRDIYVATSDDGGETFNTVKKLGEGSFPASACPMDGGSLVRVGSKLVAVFQRLGNVVAVDVASNRESPVMPGKGVFAISDDDAPIVLASDEDGPLVLARSGQTTVLAESPAVESVCAVTGGKLVVIYESKRKLHLVQLD